MKKLEGEELERLNYINKAAEATKVSNCINLVRGAVIVRSGKVIANGFDGAPNNSRCEDCLKKRIKSELKDILCYGIHAEERAILSAFRNGHDLKSATLYLVSLENGEISPSDSISCTVCSRMIAESGLKDVVVLHKKGLYQYEAKEYNELSFERFLESEIWALI